MVALIRQANSGYELASKPNIKKEKRMYSERENKNKKQNKETHKKEEARNVSEQYVKGWIHIIHVHNPTHLQHCGAADAHELPHTKKDWAVSLNIKTTPLTHTS